MLGHGLKAHTPHEGTAAGLHYLEVVTGDVQPDAPLPLVIWLHGRGDRPRIPAQPFGAVPTPMRLIIPRAPMPLGEGFTWLSVSITQGKPDLLARGLLERANQLALLIEQVLQTRPTAGRPIVAGFSQGAMLSYALAIHRPDVVGSAFPLVGWVPPLLMPSAPAGPVHPVEVRTLHGTEDPVIPIELGRDVARTLADLQWDIEMQEFDGAGHTMTAAMNARFETWLDEALVRRAQASP